MAYDADPAATHNPATSTAPPASWGDILNANFAAIGAAWTTFTPTWTGVSSDPALGNGSSAGGYIRLGKLLLVRYWIKMGSTTTFGSGAWRLTLPASLTVATTRDQVLSAFGFDDSADFYYVGAGSIGQRVGLSDRLQIGFNATSSASSTVPFTWATSDVLTVEGVLELA